MDQAAFERRMAAIAPTVLRVASPSTDLKRSILGIEGARPTLRACAGFMLAHVDGVGHARSTSR